MKKVTALRRRTHSVRVNISLPPVLRDASSLVIQRKGFVGLSDYFQACLRRDAAALGMHEFDLSS